MSSSKRLVLIFFVVIFKELNYCTITSSQHNAGFLAEYGLNEGMAF